ncbi:MAG: hypothetical protein COC17_04180 [Hyphomicrobiales bacterium]|nr:CBS domain-containing protein [Hyphomicrobiales bacterium]PCH50777.1 MAG: hypothetical protein COC17_04180 [Hyphomicrobiales bacterium]
MLIEQLFNSVEQDDTIIAAADINPFACAQLMTANNIGALPVVDDEDTIVGILSERDVMRAIVKNKDSFFNLITQDVMTKQVICCALGDDVLEVYKILVDNKIRHIPIANNNKLIGMLSIRDFKILVM